MYNFIFSFFYWYFNKRNDITPRFSAALTVALTVFFHLFLFANIITLFLAFVILVAKIKFN